MGKKKQTNNSKKTYTKKQENKKVEKQELESPLKIAMRNDDVNAFVEELEQEIEVDPKNINKKDHNGYTLLHTAATKDSCGLPFVKELLKNKADVNAKDNKENTPLHVGAMGNNEFVIQCLLNNNADINAPNDQGLTPLHFSIFSNHVKVTDLLIKNGASIYAEAKDGCTPFFISYTERNNSIFKLLHDQNKVEREKLLGQVENQAAEIETLKKNLADAEEQLQKLPIDDLNLITGDVAKVTLGETNDAEN